MSRFGRTGFSARPAAAVGRSANPRAPGRQSSPAGSSAAALPFLNPFISAHVPVLWQALAREFGLPAEYWLDGDSGQAIAITIVWKEGAEDEEASPGRYSRALVQNSDLTRAPQQGDALAALDTIYDVVRVDAMPYAMSSIVLQDRAREAY
jgi:hypothetical protein